MSMTRDQMVHYLHDSSTLNERTLGELREILEAYPYFQTAHLLYTRNLQMENNFRFSNQLKTCAIYAADRTVLYHLLNPVPVKKQIRDHLQHVKVPEDQSDLEIIEISDDAMEKDARPDGTWNLQTDRIDNEPFDLLNFELAGSTWSLEGSEKEADKPLAELVKDISHLASKKRKNPEQKVDLIDRFIQDNPAFNIRQPEDNKTVEKSDLQLDNTVEREEFITETLARIYSNQGLYQKAIHAFEKLSLKYPEKSAYFARQIDEITNMLNK